MRWVSSREWPKILGKKKVPWGVFFYDEGVPTILLDDVMKRKRWGSLRNGTILHEMVHLTLKGRDRHGKAFEREMQRLARLGAFKGIW